MKLLFLINSLHTAGGTERVATIIANKLAEQGYDIGLVVLHGGGEPFFEVSKKAKLHYINEKGVKNIYLSFLSNICKLRKLYKTERPDYVIDVCSAMSLMSIPAARGGVSKVITWEHFNSNVDWNPITTPLSRKLAKRYSHKIVTLTHQDAENYAKRYGAKNVDVIPNPVTIEVDQPTSLNSKTVLAVGRFTPQKGFDMLLPAWAKTTERNNGWRLRIIGHGEMEAQLKKIVVDLDLSDSVEILPPTQNIVEQYQSASIYVMSSRFEGLPLVLIEAMAMGLPIVSFDCETGPRDVVESGVTGVLVEDGNVEKLAIELDSLMREPARLLQYSQNAIKQSAKFELPAIITKWRNLLETQAI